MANSDNYTATKEDSRPWRAGHDTRASDLDEASVANAEAIQEATWATNPIDEIAVTPATVTLDVSDEDTQQLTVAGLVDSEASTAGFLVTYESSDPTKATVDENGLVTPLAAGETTITATAVHNDTITDTCVVTVTA